MTIKTPQAVQAPYPDVDFGKYIVLQSNDTPPQEFCITREATKQSVVLSGALTSVSSGKYTSAEHRRTTPVVVPVPGVPADMLVHVITYMEHHVQEKAPAIEKPLRAPIKEVIGEWDFNFLTNSLLENGDESKHGTLLAVLSAANYLHIQDLIDLTSASVASMIRGKSVEEIRTLFGIKNDFTPEEEARIREENAWCEVS
eukprot:CAMPEP_0201477350 /NCGR_PEP_ID=MMETSP0151_2-20130828/2383_1 /ASSEMBLY_ACC=CAM_ASM_000257 /TAXON_ID=200890 /ORGANISM="Paramoeba atlantica, Strain 621/1 / CCAP 1560/9" /LENGTH=199 /DNA_ID=CAMNT_0047858031 /DNA_START=56 /DNA_END=655 /DNA_ORIENTATION=-